MNEKEYMKLMYGIHEEYIYEESKESRDKNRYEPYRYKSLKEIRLTLRTLVKTEAREKEEHSDHSITSCYEYIKAVPYEPRIKPRCACVLSDVVKNNDYCTKTEKTFGLVKRHYILIPCLPFTDLHTEEQQQGQSCIDQYKPQNIHISSSS